jgi:5-azacytidine-induced protein 1
MDPRGTNCDVINEYYQCINEIINQQNDSKKKYDSNLNNNNSASSASNNFSQEQKIVNSDKNKLESSSAVIKNYLKTKEQNTVNSSKSNLKNPEATKKVNKKTNVKPKSAGGPKPAAPVRPNSTGKSLSSMKKAKSSPFLAREDSNVNEFHMEKVVSWMSSHEDTFSEHSEHLKPNIWPESRENSANSRVKVTDDEGNYSSEDRRDSDDSIASMIKEMKEADRTKQETDFKNLKADVEFKLNTILGSAESRDSAVMSEDGDIKMDQKIKDIYSYLDQVESKCDKQELSSMATKSIIAPSESDRSETEFTLEPDLTEDVPK